MLHRLCAPLLAAFIPMSVTAHENVSIVTNDGTTTCITSNGAPAHDMGQFPNRANPNAFRTQSLSFCFTSTPQLARGVTEGLMTVGVSLSGVPFRPYTAGYYDPNGRRGFSQNPSSGWRQQAMYDPRSLGMDTQDAHVDRSGLYHYHSGMSDYLTASSQTLIGYAPDGFQIHYSPASATSSWQLKSGTRPSGPGVVHDGTFEEDFEYRAGTGSLDECNGAIVNGTYTYFATDSYPYFPRCFKGAVNTQFMTRG